MSNTHVFLLSILKREEDILEAVLFGGTAAAVASY